MTPREELLTTRRLGAAGAELLYKLSGSWRLAAGFRRRKVRSVGSGAVRKLPIASFKASGERSACSTWPSGQRTTPHSSVCWTRRY